METTPLESSTKSGGYAGPQFYKYKNLKAEGMRNRRLDQKRLRCGATNSTKCGGDAEPEFYYLRNLIVVEMRILRLDQKRKNYRPRISYLLWSKCGRDAEPQTRPNAVDKGNHQLDQMRLIRGTADTTKYGRDAEPQIWLNMEKMQNHRPYVML